MAFEQTPEVVAAFEELGLARDTPPEQLRRAYLRVIKTRKPEQDPEGFRRAREAFELLTNWFAFLAATTPDAEAGPELPPQPQVASEAPATGWVAVQQHFRAGRIDEGRALAQDLFAAGDAPPDPVRLVGALLELQHLHPGAQARATLRSFLTWVERANLELLFSRQPDRWVMLREFAKLPAEVPVEVEASLARFLLDGDLEAALLRIELYTREHPAESDAAILPLSGASTVLHQLLTPVLNIELIAQRADWDKAPQGRIEPVPSGMPVSGATRALFWPLLVAFLLLKLWSSTGPNFSPYSPQSPTTHAIPAVAVPPPGFGLKTPSLGTVSLSPIEELCTLSTSDCLAARGVRARLAASDCLGARREYIQIVNSNTLIGRSRAAEVLRMVQAELSAQVETCRGPR